MKKKDTKATKKTAPKNDGKKEAEALKKELQETKEALDEAQQKFVRLFSEFDNYKKRTAREKSDLLKGANEPVIKDMILILDDFERAIESAKSSENQEALMEGVELIHDKFKKSLEKSGMKPIEALGTSFDSDLHEAISQMPAPSKKEKGKVVQEVEKGYMLNDKVVRYSKVIVGA